MEKSAAKLDGYALQQLIAPGGTSAVYAGLKQNGFLDTPWQVAIKFVWQPELGRNEARNLVNLGNIKGVVNLLEYFEVAYSEVELALASLHESERSALRQHSENPRQPSDQVGVLVLQFLAGEPLVIRTEPVAGDWQPKDPARVFRVQDIETGFWLRQDLARDFDLRTRIKILQAIAKYVAECHARGIVHGDLKPQNILYNPENDQVTILDFGGGTSWTRGTPGWQAPEHLRLALGELESAPKVLDIFLLGLFLNRFLEPFSVLGAKALTERCLGPPSQRPTAAELENELEKISANIERHPLRKFGLPVMTLAVFGMLLWWVLS